MLWIETIPKFAVIYKETGLINELEGDANNLFEALHSVAGVCVVAVNFDLVEKGFVWLVDIIRGAKNSVVFLKTRKGDVGVGGIQVIQDGAGGGEALSNVLFLKGADEQFVNSREKNFLGALSVRLYSLKSAEAVSKA